MQIIFLDDSIPFDGFTPAALPLGGAEKAVIGLATALAARGHDVTVHNRCKFRMPVEGVNWETWDRPLPPRAEVVVAFRKPTLFEHLGEAAHKVLWLAAPAKYLETPRHREILDIHRPTLLFFGAVHRASWTGKGLRTAIIPPGVRRDYLADLPMTPADPPVAVVTTHPLHDLDWLVKLWVERIRPACPAARLHIYSMGFYQAIHHRAPLDERLIPVFKTVAEAHAHGVHVLSPEADPGMAAAYREARVHLYPGLAGDVLCSTLAESQAVGLPAVARPLGATVERIQNGQSGYLVPDADAFANLAIQILNDEAFFLSLSHDAQQMQRRHDWDLAAQAFERMVAEASA